MKKPELKIKKINLNLSKKLPYIFVVLFLAIGIFVVAYGYVLLNRKPDTDFVTKIQGEINDLSVKFSKKKTEQLFDANYDTSKIDNPGYEAKNPFLDF